MKTIKIKKLLIVSSIIATTLGFIACDSNEHVDSTTKESSSTVSTVEPAKSSSASTSTSTKTSTPTVDYGTAIAPILESIGDSWISASKILGTGAAIYNEDNKISLCSDFISIQNKWKEYNNFQANDSKSKGIKAKLDTVRDKQLLAIDKMIYGLDNYDVNSMKAANKLLDEGTAIVNTIH